MAILRLDYETRSRVDLKTAGAYEYAADPSTDILCVAWKLGDGPVRRWAPKIAPDRPRELFSALENPEVEIHAWNAAFERLITSGVLWRDRDDEPPALERYWCTAAHARARGLPGNLDDAGKTIGVKKDMEGHRLMLRLCKPDKTDEFPELHRLDLARLMAYCEQDVIVEAAMATVLACVPLTKREREDYLLCEQVNDTGLAVDRPFALHAARCGTQELQSLREALSALTSGAIDSPSQHARVKGWLAAELPRRLFKRHFHRGDKVVTDKRAREAAIDDPALAEYPFVVALLELINAGAKASVAKYHKLAERSVSDGRARGAYVCFGAPRTKRFSSHGIQFHNFPRGRGHVAALHKRIRAGEDVTMDELASQLRSTIVAPPGRVLIWGDWSAIEARTLPWAALSADGEAKLDLYREGVDVYVANAAKLFATGPELVTTDQRQLGKVQELSLQFGGATGALRAMARNYGVRLDDTFAQRAVDAWRDSNRWATRFWDQIAASSMQAFKAGGVAEVGRVVYEAGEVFARDGVGYRALTCRLPSGTVLYYPGTGLRACPPSWIESEEEVARWETRFRMQAKDDSSFELYEPATVDARTLINTRADGYRLRVGPGWMHGADYLFESEAPGWSLWYGLLAENIAQAIAADLLRDTLSNLDLQLADEFPSACIVGHTHDEIIVEADSACRDGVKALLHSVMVAGTVWSAGLPLNAEVTSGLRYSK